MRNMKKGLVILLAALALFSFVSCKDEPEPEPPAPVLKKRIEKDYSKNRSLQGIVTTEYDAKGNEIKVTFQYGDESILYVFEYAYDANGNMTLQKATSASGTVLDWVEHEYDSHNNETKKINKYSDGSINNTREWVFEYNTSGNPVKISKKHDGVLDSWRELSYDTNGRLIRDSYKDVNGTPEGELTEYYEYEYTANGYTEYKKNSAGVTLSFEVYENGKRVKSEASSGAGTTYTYDENGKLTQQYQYDDSGNGYDRYVYTYDANGNEIEMIDTEYSYVDEEWHVYDWYKKEYDSEGRLVKETYYDADVAPAEVVDSWSTYTYIYE